MILPYLATLPIRITPSSPLGRWAWRWRYVLAGAGVFLAQLLLLILICGTTGAALIASGGEGEDIGAAGGFVVSVQGRNGAGAPARPRSQPATLDVRASDAEAVLLLAAASDAALAAPPQSGPLDVSAAKSQSVDALSGPAKAQTDAPKADAATDRPGAKSSGNLWGAVRTCWKSVADRDTVPVTLEIEVSMTGAITKPPKVVRGADRVFDARSARSEALALSAVAACAPFTAAIGRGPVRIQFPGGGA